MLKTNCIRNTWYSRHIKYSAKLTSINKNVKSIHQHFNFASSHCHANLLNAWQWQNCKILSYNNSIALANVLHLETPAYNCSG